MTLSFSQLISTFFYLGYLPFSASLVSLPAILFFLFIPHQLSWLIIIIFLGIITTDYFSKLQKQSDPKYIIVDEFVGQLISLYQISPSLIHLTLSVVLFRLFDLTKPFFIKSSQKLPGGWGIIIDDILAGLLANLLLRLISLYL